MSSHDGDVAERHRTQCDGPYGLSREIRDSDINTTVVDRSLWGEGVQPTYSRMAADTGARATKPETHRVTSSAGGARSRPGAPAGAESSR